MPTGYTADVAEGKVDFRTFTLRCARQFGACIMQRDDPMGDMPKHREPSDFYDRSLHEAEKRLAFLLTLTLEQAAAEAEREYYEAKERHQEYEVEKRERKARYDAMLADVVSWDPPTASHEGLKDFMVKQLTESIDWDCKPYAFEMVKADGQQWLEDNVERTRALIKRYAGEVAAERTRCAEANTWIDQLYASLSAEPVSA